MILGVIRMSLKTFTGTRKKAHLIALGIGSLSLIIGLTGTPASAASAAGEVREISIETKSAKEFDSVLKLTFDKPVTQGEADRIRQDMSKQAPVQMSKVEDYISCEGDLTRSNQHGTWTVQYVCFNGYGTIPWGFKIAPNVQAIAASNVTEDGLRWWRNGASMPKNAGHNVPAWYHFHGTMNPVYHYNTVQYQDYLTFRHNLGSGGTATLTFAGALDLLP